MLILNSKLGNLPVIELENQQKVASIDHCLIDPKNGKLLGLIVRIGQIITRNKFIAEKDLTQILPTAVLVANEDKVDEIGEVVRANELYKKKFHLIGLKVKTKSGRFLGKIEDFLISDELRELVKIYVRNLFSDRIIPYSAIVKIDQHGVTVKDDFEAISVLDRGRENSEAEAELA
jgi:uncharacterized protein YrrD